MDKNGKDIVTLIQRREYHPDYAIVKKDGPGHYEIRMRPYGQRYDADKDQNHPVKQKS